MYTAKDYSHLLGTEGFSDALLSNHFTLYQGYVTNTNKLGDELAAMLAEGKTGTPSYNELKRRAGWEFNGMRLHEYYFENMEKGGIATTDTSALKAKIVEDFGSWEAWEKDFRATGAMRGIGWAIMYHDTVSNKLINTWVDEHNTGNLAGASPILIMDVFEHAFMLDYGLKRADYIESFFKAIDWSVAEKRFGGK